MTQRIEFTTQEFIEHFPVMSCAECTHLEGRECDMYEGFKITKPKRPCRCLHFNQILEAVNPSK